MVTTAILAGDFKGTRLNTGRVKRMRPTLSKVREAIFNLVSGIAGTAALDLYAGAGTLGFEALSRGAVSITFVDHDRKATRLIQKNSLMFGHRQMTIVQDDSIRFLRKSDARFDIILADPPYGTGALPLLKDLALQRLTDDGTLIIESAAREKWRDEDAVVKRYGDTQISVFRRSP